MDYLKEYKKWCESDEFAEETKQELLRSEEHTSELQSP